MCVWVVVGGGGGICSSVLLLCCFFFPVSRYPTHTLKTYHITNIFVISLGTNSNKVNFSHCVYVPRDKVAVIYSIKGGNQHSK